jgi:hypothetical protein
VNATHFTIEALPTKWYSIDNSYHLQTTRRTTLLIIHS